MSTSKDHGRPGAGSEPAAEQPLQSAKAPSHAERCRSLAQRARSATLCTLARDPAGYPYGSLVTVAVDAHGRPLLLLSALAEHTGNLKVRPEASLLLAEPAEGLADPLALGRMTLIGPCRPLDGSEAAAARTSFLAGHPRASYYVDFY